MKKIIIIIIIVILSSCSSGKDTSTAKTSSTKSSHKNTKVSPKSVVTKKIKPSTIIKYKTYNSILNPQKDIFISSQANGIITKLNFDMGKNVKKGDLLAVIDTRLKKIDLDLKKTLKDEAEQELKYVKSLFEKDKLLFEKKILNKESYDASKNRVLAAGFAFKKSKLALNLAEIVYKNSFIYSPFDGLITLRLKQEGDMSSMGMPIARLIDNKNLELVIGVTWEDLNQIQLYSKDKDIIVVSPDNKKCKAKIIGISETLDDITSLYPIKIALNECNFINGTQVKINIPIKEYKDVIEVKRDVLSLVNNEYYLFIYKDGKAIKTKVKLLDDNNDKMIISMVGANLRVRPITTDTRVSHTIDIIINGQIGLKDKEKVIVAGNNESN